ncbi:hypothetical protein PoB_002396500 [Plakobranchus ocellatus]|uniref:Uncharacterized protein n=1 Tax=Plakobranchus ocellatus TaxID=259542 RepID=A0AAV3ZP24_9GAST|nr:hypothetical protein PoB_002396500 [Plakobranchus ocellatus]
MLTTDQTRLQVQTSTTRKVSTWMTLASHSNIAGLIQILVSTSVPLFVTSSVHSSATVLELGAGYSNLWLKDPTQKNSPAYSITKGWTPGGSVVMVTGIERPSVSSVCA